jgi:uncharacterized protein YktA (UPF0223 family)
MKGRPDDEPNTYSAKAVSSRKHVQSSLIHFLKKDSRKVADINHVKKLINISNTVGNFDLRVSQHFRPKLFSQSKRNKKREPPPPADSEEEENGEPVQATNWSMTEAASKRQEIMSLILSTIGAMQKSQTMAHAQAYTLLLEELRRDPGRLEQIVDLVEAEDKSGFQQMVTLKLDATLAALHSLFVGNIVKEGKKKTDREHFLEEKFEEQVGKIKLMKEMYFADLSVINLVDFFARVSSSGEFKVEEDIVNKFQLDKYIRAKRFSERDDRFRQRYGLQNKYSVFSSIDQVKARPQGQQSVIQRYKREARFAVDYMNMKLLDMTRDQKEGERISWNAQSNPRKGFQRAKKVQVQSESVTSFRNSLRTNLAAERKRQASMSSSRRQKQFSYGPHYKPVKDADQFVLHPNIKEDLGTVIFRDPQSQANLLASDKPHYKNVLPLKLLNDSSHQKAKRVHFKDRSTSREFKASGHSLHTSILKSSIKGLSKSHSSSGPKLTFKEDIEPYLKKDTQDQYEWKSKARQMMDKYRVLAEAVPLANHYKHQPLLLEPYFHAKLQLGEAKEREEAGITAPLNGMKVYLNSPKAQLSGETRKRRLTGLGSLRASSGSRQATDEQSALQQPELPDDLFLTSLYPAPALPKKERKKLSNPLYFMSKTLQPVRPSAARSPLMHTFYVQFNHQVGELNSINQHLKSVSRDSNYKQVH